MLPSMTRASLLARFLFRRAALRVPQAVQCPHRFVRPKGNCLPRTFRTFRRPGYGRNSIILAFVLSPAAFIKLSEEENGNDETTEGRMLQASRQEIKTLGEDIH